MDVIWLVAQNTFRQTVRQKLFYNIAVFGVGMLMLSMVVGNITYGYPDRVVRSVGLAGVNMALNLMALLVGATLVHQEIDRKTLFVVLVRPVYRWQYVAGRYLGLIATLAVTAVGLSLTFLFVLSSVHGKAHAGDVTALVATLPEAALMGGVGILLSCFSTPLLSVGLGLGIYLVAASTDDFVALAHKSGAPGMKILAQLVYYLFPCLARFNFRDQAIYQTIPSLGEFMSTMVYGVLYALALGCGASAILSRREMI